MGERIASAFLYWALGIGFYSGLNYLQGSTIQVSFVAGWTAASIVYGFLAPIGKKT